MMQMPSRPEATSRIVIFRMEEDRMKGYAPALVPAVMLNDENLGEIAANSLIIRDVTPGEYRVSLTGKTDMPEFKPLKATLNAADEWFIETGVKVDNCKGPSPGKVTPRTGVLEVDAVTGIFDMLRVGYAAANTSCASALQLEAAWPQTSRWRINPLLQKYGAQPQEFALIPDAPIPQSDLSWRDAEYVIRVHFDSTANAGKYKAFTDPAGRGSLHLKEITLAGSNGGMSAGVYEVPVVIEYLHIDEETLAGRYVKRPMRYSLRREGETLTVVNWTDAN